MAAAQGEFGKLVIGYTDSALHTVLSEIVWMFCDRTPQVELTLHESCLQQETALLTKISRWDFYSPF